MNPFPHRESAKIPVREIVPHAAERVIRVLVAEDHAMMREGLVALLRQSRDVEVCGETDNAVALLELARSAAPDVVVMDLFLGAECDGVRLVRELRRLVPPPRVLVMSMHSEQSVAEQVARAGAQGFINKRESTRALLDVVRSLMTGEDAFGPRVTARLLDRTVAAEGDAIVGTLTARELQIFRLIGSGAAVGEIAERLGVSAKTVAAHRENLKNKLTCHTAGELAARARRWLGLA